jgi:hypothetical protein
LNIFQRTGINDPVIRKQFAPGPHSERFSIHKKREKQKKKKNKLSALHSYISLQNPGYRVPEHTTDTAGSGI